MKILKLIASIVGAILNMVAGVGLALTIHGGVPLWQ